MTESAHSFEMFLIIIIVFSVFSVVIHSIKSKRRESIREHGFYYNNVLKLNERYHFAQTTNSYVINHPAKSKAAFDRLKPNDIVIYYFENNLNGFTENFERIIANYNLFSDYTDEYNKLMGTDHSYPTEMIKSTPFKTVDSFLKCEKKMTQNILIKAPYKITVKLNAYYSSPKGKNQYRKSYEYSFENLCYCYAQWIDAASYKVSAAYERSLMTDSLRYDILKRDNFRCQICGASASDGVKLHVDHIIPVSKGGKTEPSNLQTLCERCNLGKSNKL